MGFRLVVNISKFAIRYRKTMENEKELSQPFQGKRALYRDALRNLIQISDPNEDPTYFQDSVVEGLIDMILDGELAILIDPKDQ